MLNSMGVREHKTKNQKLNQSKYTYKNTFDRRQNVGCNHWYKNNASLHKFMAFNGQRIIVFE